MNMVLDDAAEIDATKKTTKSLGRILLKGDTIALMQTANPTPNE
jgi:small nuclear ribonucleoprotein (snRNP)-like protein